MAKADSEQLARSIAEEQLSDVEKEKTMLELELKEAMSRLKSDISKKDMIVSSVSHCRLNVTSGCSASQLLGVTIIIKYVTVVTSAGVDDETMNNFMNRC